MEDKSQKIDPNERGDTSSFSNEEKALLKLIAEIIVEISFEESYEKSKEINNEKELE